MNWIMGDEVEEEPLDMLNPLFSLGLDDDIIGPVEAVVFPI